MANGVIYDKVNDVICRLNRGAVTVQFSVVLNKKDKIGKSNNYYHVYEYQSNKYVNANYARSIRRDFSYYVTVKTAGSSKALLIKPENMYLLRAGLTKTIEWFTTERYKGLFKISNNILVVDRSIEVGTVTIPAAYDKDIKIAPSVININDSVTTGVKMKFGDEQTIPVTLEELYAFHYHMMELNMYQAASTIISSLETPELNESNYTKMSDNNMNSYQDNTSFSKNYNTKRSPKSIFDL